MATCAHPSFLQHLVEFQCIALSRECNTQARKADDPLVDLGVLHHNRSKDRANGQDSTIFLETLGVAYAAVPKAACMSVKLILSQLDPEFVAPTNPQRLRLHKRYRTSRFRMSR